MMFLPQADPQTQPALQLYGTGPGPAGHLSQGQWNHLHFVATQRKAVVAWLTDLGTCLQALYPEMGPTYDSAVLEPKGSQETLSLYVRQGEAYQGSGLLCVICQISGC